LVYIASGEELTVRMLKDIAHRAGIHIYSDREQPVYANSKFITIHTATGGKQKIRLPRESAAVKEIFSNRIIAENCREFEYDFLSPDTALFMW